MSVYLMLLWARNNKKTKKRLEKISNNMVKIQPKNIVMSSQLTTS